MKYLTMILPTLILSCLLACSTSENSEANQSQNLVDGTAAITGVKCIGQPNNYTLEVTIESPDTGCDQYADWWEVFTEDGALIYRRILTHSHVNEQPFTRSGGKVDVGPDEFVYVRAHMNNLGYGSAVFSGTLRNDLEPDSLDVSFAENLASLEPLPSSCDF